MSEQLFLEAFNSEPYFFEKEEKYGAMDIIYTFEDEAGHGFKFHFEKKVALGKHAYVCVLSQKTPGLKTYKRVIGKFSNPMRTVATLLAVVRDIHDTRKDVHGIVMSIPEQAFGSYSRLVKKIMTRELRTVLNVEDGEYTPEDFEKMGLVGIVTTVKPRNMNTVYTGPALKEYQERQAGKDGAGISAPAAVVPDVNAPSIAQSMPSQTKEITTIEFEVTRYSKDESTAFNASIFARNTVEGSIALQLMRDKIKKIAGKNGQLPAVLSRHTFIEKGVLKARFDSDFLPEVVEMLKKFEDSTIKLRGIEKLEDLIPKQPVVDPVAVKDPYYFDYDHRQITLTFDNAETAGRIKDQLLELGAATFNDSEFFTNKEKLILLDDKSLDVKKVQATLFPILGQPVTMNGVNLDPNVRSSVRSPDGVTYHIKGNTIQVEDAPKDTAMVIIRELLPMADRIFDDKGSNTLELNSQGIADGFSIDNIAPVLKNTNLAKRLSAKLFRSWESAVTEASSKYELSTGDFGSSFTNNSSYLIDIATSGVVGEYILTAGNVISGIVLKSNYKIRESVAKPLVALGFNVEYDVQGWRTKVKLPVNSDYTIPGTSELALFIKEVDNLANIARNRTVEEFVGGNKDFRAKWNPDSSRVFLILPTAESSGLGWRDYTAYATASKYVRVDNIESYEEFLKLVEFAKNFDFGANLLRNIGVSKYLSDVRSGGAKASKSYKLKDGGEVEISFKFGDKVTFIFNQNSEGFDKEMSEFADEKIEIFGRTSAILLYMLGTGDANKTLKNIDAWLDAHIVSKEDNASSASLTLNAGFSSGNDYSASVVGGVLQIHDQREGVVSSLSGINLDGVPAVVSSGVELHIREPEFKKASFQGVVVDKTISVDNVKFVIKKADGTLIGRIELNSSTETSISSKEDNSPKEVNQSTEALIDQEIQSKISWAEQVLQESLSHNTSGHTVGKVEFVGTTRPTKDHVLYIFKLLVRPKFGAAVQQKAFVKGTIGLDVVTGYSGTGQNRQPMIKPVSIALDRSVTSWVGYDYDPKVADQYEKTMTFASNTAAKPEKVKQSGTLEIVASLSNSIYTHYITVQDGSLTTMSENGSPRSEGFWRFAPKGMTYSDGEEFVKAEIMKMYDSGASNLAVKEKVNEWLKSKDGYVIDVRGDRTSSGVKGTTDKNPKNLVKPLLTAIASVAKDGKEKKVTGFDLRVGETWAYDGHRGEMNNLLFISGSESTSLDSKIRSLGGAVLLRGVTNIGDLTIEFEDDAKKRKSKLTFTCGGLVQGSFESLKGSFSPATKSKVDKLISKMFTDSPQAIANEFADFIGNPDLRYKIVKDARKPAILISKNPEGFKEALKDAELLMESFEELNEGIKEDLTGKAPNRVKRELLEATLQKLGLYRESFAYGNATFKTVMTECAVEIIPTSGNIRNFAKMLGARLGQELRIDDEGFLSFDLDNI